jgi:hypothetical protein
MRRRVLRPKTGSCLPRRRRLLLRRRRRRLRLRRVFCVAIVSISVLRRAREMLSNAPQALNKSGFFEEEVGLLAPRARWALKGTQRAPVRAPISSSSAPGLCAVST